MLALWQWCGPLCQRLGLAAWAASYLTVSVVTVILIYGVYLLWTLFIRPGMGLLWRTALYLLGRSAWREILPGGNGDPPPPDWCGPGAARPWSAQYVQKEVRGRGEDRRLPLDLMICCDGSYARLRHGPLKGRTNRHGFVCAFDELVGWSSFALRRRLEAGPQQVHLCAAHPCTEGHRG